MTQVGLLGSGPAIEAANAALGDTSAGAREIDPASLSTVDVAIAVGSVTDEDVRQIGAAARGSEVVLVTVELGGIGGVPVAGVDAAVAGLAPVTACFDCLQRRVEAVDPDRDEGSTDPPTERLAGAIAGREVARLVGGAESPLLGGVIEIPHATRRILPVPNCECGDLPDRDLRLDSTERSLEDALAAAEIAFDARLGPITSVGEVESFPVPYYLATLADAPFSDADVPDYAAGVALEWDPAFMKALGEALERYSAAIYREDRLLTDPDAPVDPRRFVRPDASDPDVRRWFPATNLSTDQAVALPAELVVFPPPERSIRPAITTGLGLGNGGGEAVVSGLTEVIERDATMLSWYSTYEPLELVVDDEDYRTLIRRASSEGLETTALLLTQDIDVPVIGVCVHREDEWPKFAAGSAAALDPVEAARGAAEEAVQNWLELRRMGPDRASRESGAIGFHADFPDAAREFVDAETTIAAETVGPADPPRGADALDPLVTRVEAAGLVPYAARVTPRDVESLGFEAVRVVVPEAQPLFTGDPYFGERARHIPESLGFESRLDREMHPFP